MKKAIKTKTAYHEKRYGHHQKRNKSFHDTYLPYLPMTLILFLSLFISGYTPQRATLAYATEMNHQTLLNATNTQRSNFNRGSLTLNNKLNGAAQAKADDMVSRNYWSHNTPDGQEPWVFINRVNYDYQKAGENLAYGFVSSSETINGWMNSPTHKENLLDSEFTEVGFGFANSDNFNNSGEETIVVAMYGKPYVLSALAQQEPSSPTPQESPAPTIPSKPISQPQPQINPQSTQPQPQTVTPMIEDTSQQSQKEVVLATAKSVTQAETLSSKVPSWTLGVITFVVGFLLAILLLRHGIKFRKLIKNSRTYVTHHPLIDSTILALIVLGIVLLRNTGNIL